MNTLSTIKVWDLPVRIFHWSLVTAFLIAYLTEDDLLILHSYAGYTIMGLVGFRLIWGVIGTRHARFSDFIKRPAVVHAYIKDALQFRAKRFIGHNPAGGAMVIALLLSLMITTATGLMTYGSEEFSGPLAETMRELPYFIGKLAEEVHEFFANFTLLLVLLHVAGVVMASFQHGENLVRSMFTGFKDAE